MKPDIFEIFRTFSRYLEKNFEIFRKKSGISGNIFRRFFVIFVSRPRSIRGGVRIALRKMIAIKMEHSFLNLIFLFQNRGIRAHPEPTCKNGF